MQYQASNYNCIYCKQNYYYENALIVHVKECPKNPTIRRQPPAAIRDGPSYNYSNSGDTRTPADDVRAGTGANRSKSMARSQGAGNLTSMLLKP